MISLHHPSSSSSEEEEEGGGGRGGDRGKGVFDLGGNTGRKGGVGAPTHTHTHKYPKNIQIFIYFALHIFRVHLKAPSLQWKSPSDTKACFLFFFLSSSMGWNLYGQQSRGQTSDFNDVLLFQEVSVMQKICTCSLALDNISEWPHAPSQTV